LPLIAKGRTLLAIRSKGGTDMLVNRLAPTFFVLAGCLSLAVAGCGDDLGANCKQLQQMCPKCTLSLAKNLCDNAVASKDEKSCQDGLSDKDIQTYCSGSTPADSGSSKQDKGGSSQLDGITSNCGCAACYSAVKAACTVCPTDADCDTAADQCQSAKSLYNSLGCTGCVSAAQASICK
jgi:hypothetical protein